LNNQNETKSAPLDTAQRWGQPLNVKSSCRARVATVRFREAGAGCVSSRKGRGFGRAAGQN
jgi:hypothetical protein